MECDHGSYGGGSSAEGFGDRAVYVFGSPHLQRYYFGTEIVWLGVCRVIQFLLVRWLLLSRIGICVSRFSVTALYCGGLAVSSCRWLGRVTVVNLAL